MSLYTMSNKEAGATVRKALKAAGFATRDISVRVRDAGYNTSVRVTVKNPRISLKAVEQVTRQFSEVDRDERTGEILQGCNVYVFTEYADGIFDELGAAYLEDAKRIIAATLDENRTDCTVCRRGADYLTTYADNCGRIGLHQGTDDDTAIHEYRPHRWHYKDYPLSLAIDLWRFHELGSIYA